VFLVASSVRINKKKFMRELQERCVSLLAKDNVSKKNEQVVSAIPGTRESAFEEKEEEPEPSSLAKPKIRMAGSNFIGSIRIAKTSNHQLKSAILHPVVSDGVTVEALVDSGALVSATNLKTVEDNAWPINKSSIQLLDAAENLLDCRRK